METNKLELEINNLITEVERGLLKGHINTNTPQVALDEQTKLGAYLSMCYGMIERLDTKEAEYFVNNRESKKSDLSVKKDWKVSHEGVRQSFWENRIKRLKVLIESLEKIYYQAKHEQQFKLLK